MGREKIPFKVGDVVKVRDGLMCPDDKEVPIGGWIGRITEIWKELDEVLICIHWDSITLASMPSSYISQLLKDELTFEEMYLYPEDMVMAEARDTQEDVLNVLEEIECNYTQHWLAEKERRLFHLPTGIEEEDVFEEMESWVTYLREKLKFPFKAEVSNFQGKGPMRWGDRVTVKKIDGYDDKYGVIVKINKGNFPLVDLEVLDTASENYQLVEYYRAWFANS